MFSAKNHEQTIIDISQGDYIVIAAESFMIDRQSSGLSQHTLKFYRQFLNPFTAYCNANSFKLIGQINPDILRRYFLIFAETHNPGGVHAAYRTLRAFFHWLAKEEVMAPEWKNPMLRVKAPKVSLEPLEPISIEDVRTLINICPRGNFIGERDRAIFLFLLDTGVRAQELCSTDTKTGVLVIKKKAS